MNPQVKLLAGGGAAGVSQVASSCRRLPWRRPPRWDLEGCFFFFSPPLGLQPDGGPSRVGRPTRPHRPHRVTAAVPGQTKPSVRRPARTNDFVRVMTEEHVWLPAWSAADNRTMASSPSLFSASCSVVPMFVFRRFHCFCVSLSLYCLRLIFFFFFCKWIFIPQTNEPKFFSLSFETWTVFWQTGTFKVFWIKKFECTIKNRRLWFFFFFPQVLFLFFSASAPQKTSSFV